MTIQDQEDSVGENAADAIADVGLGIGEAIFGDTDKGVDQILDGVTEALDVITDDGFSRYVDRLEDASGVDLREFVHEGIEVAGEALGDAAWAVHQAVEGAYDTVSEGVGDAVDWVSDTAGEVYDTVEGAYDTVADTASEAYDTVTDTAEAAYDEVASWFE